MSALSERAQISRLTHRFNFGPLPGQFETMLFEGLSPSRVLIRAVPATDSGVVTLIAPVLNDLGPPPASDSSQYAAYASAVATQKKQLMYWWLDRMVLSQNPLPERMTWF